MSAPATMVGKVERLLSALDGATDVKQKIAILRQAAADNCGHYKAPEAKNSFDDKHYEINLWHIYAWNADPAQVVDCWTKQARRSLELWQHIDEANSALRDGTYSDETLEAAATVILHEGTFADAITRAENALLSMGLRP